MKMYRVRLLCLASLVLAATLVSSPLQAAYAQNQGVAQVQSQIAAAFVSVQSAEQSGGNVTQLAAELNSALALVARAEAINATNPSGAQALLSQASSLALNVTKDAPTVAAAGRASVAAAQTALAVETAALLALAAVAYVYVPKVFWRLWLRSHRDWRVKKR